MTANILQNERDGAIDVTYDSPRTMDWFVKEDPKLQAELNESTGQGKELSSKVVNKVLNRIKDL